MNLDSVERVRAYTVGRHLVRIDRVESTRGAVTFRVHTRFESLELHGEDYYAADELALADAIADHAVAELRRNRRPDLLKVARDLKRRNAGAATPARRVHGGGLILGDTPPDELPPAD